MAVNIDFSATFAEISGGTPKLSQDGRSLLPVMMGKEPTPWRNALLVEGWPTGSSILPFAGVRTGDKKKYDEDANGDKEFYDLNGPLGGCKRGHRPRKRRRDNRPQGQTLRPEKLCRRLMPCGGKQPLAMRRFRLRATS